MKIIDKIIERQHERDKQREIKMQARELAQTFNVTVLAGTMFILCGTRAIKQCNPDMKVSDVLKYLEEMKNTSKNYNDQNSK
jgi:hypothetical protein